MAYRIFLGRKGGMPAHSTVPFCTAHIKEKAGEPWDVLGETKPVWDTYLGSVLPSSFPVLKEK